MCPCAPSLSLRWSSSRHAGGGTPDPRRQRSRRATRPRRAGRQPSRWSPATRSWSNGWRASSCASSKRRRRSKSCRRGSTTHGAKWCARWPSCSRSRHGRRRRPEWPKPRLRCRPSAPAAMRRAFPSWARPPSCCSLRPRSSTSRTMAGRCTWRIRRRTPRPRGRDASRASSGVPYGRARYRSRCPCGWKPWDARTCARGPGAASTSPSPSMAVRR